MQSKSESKAMKDLTDADFRARIRTSNPAHDRASFFFVEDVHSNRCDGRLTKQCMNPILDTR